MQMNLARPKGRAIKSRRYLLAFAACTLSWSSAFASVVITNVTGGGSTTVSDAIMATYSTPYTLSVQGPVGPDSVITATPSATANLATGTFFDGLTLNGTLAAGTGTTVAYLPSISVADSFTLTGFQGQIIPFSLSFVSTAHFGGSSSNGYMQIQEGFFYGTTEVGGDQQSACYTSVTDGCSGNGIYGPNQLQPNDQPYVVTFSGTVTSGASVSFTIQASGTSYFYGNNVSASNVDQTLALDPTIQFVVPQGVNVQSMSGVFPVTFAGAVPEPGTWALVLCGLGCLVFFSRRRVLTPAEN